MLEIPRFLFQQTETQVSSVYYYKGWTFKHERIPRYRRIKVTIEKNKTLRLSTAIKEKKSHIDQFLLKNEQWVRDRLEKSDRLLQGQQIQVGLPGEEFIFLGEKRKLAIQPFEETVAVRGAQLLIGNPKLNCHGRLIKIRDYYSREAKKVFPEIVKIRSKEMGLVPKRLIFRGNTSRWGSCNEQGTISLNWKLMGAPLKAIDYVVVHELAHLAHPNHGVKFWKMVGRYIPDYKIYATWLRKHHYTLDFLTEIPALHSSRWR